MLTILSILFWIAVVAGALAIWGYLSTRIYPIDPQPDSIVFATTEDGWRLALTRYRPTEPLAGAPPVILCPPGGLNSSIFDVSKETSLARYLAHHGHDVWLLDLRGRGNPFKRLPWSRRGVSWSFDDYVEFDIPAALREVCQRTGARQVQWIGFGMGALVMFGALSGPGAEQVCSVTALGAPVFFRRQQSIFNPRLVRWGRWLKPEVLIRLLSPLLGRLYPSPLRYLQNRDNIDGSVYRRALVNAVSGFSTRELLQYAEWLELDAFTAIVQRRDYRNGMASITVPTLFITGPRDDLSPADMVDATQNLLDDVEDKKLLVASRMHGMSTNYGHLDLLIGRSVVRDIFSHVLAWLDGHAGVELPDDRPSPPRPREIWEEASVRAAVEREVAQVEAIDPAEVADDKSHHDGLLDLDEFDDQQDDQEDSDLITGDVPRVPG